MKFKEYLEILDKLPQKHLSKLTKFIENNNGNKNNYYKLFVFIIKNKEIFSVSQLHDNALTNFKSKTLFSRALNQLQSISESYIQLHIISEQKVISIQREIEFINYLIANNLYKQAEKKLQLIEKEINTINFNHFDFLHHRYKLTFAKLQLQLAKDKRTDNLIFKEVYEQFAYYTDTRKLMLKSFEQNRINTTRGGQEIKTSTSNENSNSQHKHFYKIIWEQAYTLLTTPTNVKYYHNLKNAIKLHLSFLRIEESTPLIAYLMNSAHLIFRNNHLYNELFDLYSLQANKQQMLLNGNVNPQLYKNMITVCLKLGKLKQAKITLEKYKSNLPKANQLSYYNYNKATILFNKKTYKVALDLLLPLELEDIFYMLGVKRLSSMIYYEIYEMDLLESYLNAFRVYMHRIKNKLAKDRLTAHRNFINTLNKIAFLQPKEWRRKQKLIDLVKNFDFVSERQWLLEKLEEIK